jgi:hypothetical protein
MASRGVVNAVDDDDDEDDEDDEDDDDDDMVPTGNSTAVN